MKKTYKYALSLLSVALLAVTGCSSKNVTIDLNNNAPDYTHKKAEFMTFGYTPPTNGKYYENGLEINTGVDYRTKERYQEYKEAGLNVLMLQNEDAYDYNVEWEKSVLKARMETIVSAGIDKILVCDLRLYELCNASNDIISDKGEYILVDGKHIQNDLKQFPNEQALVDYLEKNIFNTYYFQPGFYGVIIRDEPFITHLPNWCRVYKAISDFDSRIFIEGNLLPYGTSKDHLKRLAPDGDKMTPEAAYRYYLTYYLDHSGAKKILMDSYPFLTGSTGSYFKDEHLTGLQIIGAVCRERNVGFEAVAQTFGGTISNQPKWDQCNAASMQWQINSLLGYGVKAFGYFTYWRKVWNNNQSGGEWFTDGTSFITNKGERTQLYYTMQSLHKEMQLMAPVLTNYDYKASSSFVQEPVLYPTQFADIKQEEFNKLKATDFTFNEGTIGLVTEMQDRNNGQYLYMVMNAMNPNLKKDDNNLIMNFTINFGSEYNAAEVYYRGVRTLVALENGVYKSSLDAGYAEYVMPYKA